MENGTTVQYVPISNHGGEVSVLSEVPVSYACEFLEHKVACNLSQRVYVWLAVDIHFRLTPHGCTLSLSVDLASYSSRRTSPL